MGFGDSFQRSGLCRSANDCAPTVALDERESDIPVAVCCWDDPPNSNGPMQSRPGEVGLLLSSVTGNIARVRLGPRGRLLGPCARARVAPMPFSAGVSGTNSEPEPKQPSGRVTILERQAPHLRSFEASDGTRNPHLVHGQQTLYPTELTPPYDGGL